MKNSKILIISSVSFAILGILLTLWFFNKGQNDWINPKKGTITEAIYGLGKVQADQKFEVKVGVMTNVSKVFVKEGDKIEKNNPLIKFEDTKIFKAPFSGTVTAVYFNEAETVFPQTIALKLENLKDKYVEVSLEQEGALRVRKGQKANIIFESLRADKFEGKVLSIFPKNEEFLAHIEVDGLGEQILTGMTADVSITIGHHEDALLIPLSSLQNGIVLIKRDGKKIKVPVKIGGIDGEWAEVLEGDIQLTDLLLISPGKK